MFRLSPVALVGMLVLCAQPAAGAAPSVRDVVAREAAILSNMHKKASSALVNVAQDPAFSALFAATDQTSRSKFKDRIDQISLRTQANFQVGEMCLIGADGAERSRIVGREIATDLDPDEARNEFFGPTMKAKPRTVYIPKIYLSDDTKAWVSAYATPIALNGKNVGLLHYEHRLDEYQRELEGGLKATGVHLMVVDESGHVIADSAGEPATAAKKEKDEDAYFKPFRLADGDIGSLRKRLGGAASGHGHVNDRAVQLDVAYQDVQGWTLVGIRSANATPPQGQEQVQD